MGPKSQADALTSRGTHAAGSSPNGHGMSAFFNIVSRITPDLGLAPLGGGKRPYFPGLSAAVHAVAPRTERPLPRTASASSPPSSCSPKATHGCPPKPDQIPAPDQLQAAIPSFRVSESDMVAVAPRSRALTPLAAARAGAGERPVPAWLEVIPGKMRILVHALPARAQIDTLVQQQLTTEYYSK